MPKKRSSAKTLHQPTVVEFECTEEDNEMSLAVRGSLEWLIKVMPFVFMNLGYLTGYIWPDATQSQRDELLAAINSLQEHKSYQGDFINIQIAQETKQ